MFSTLPMIMTWTRIVAIPLILLVFYLPISLPVANLVATIMFVVFALTDWLDGYLARKLNQTSAFGAFLDPVADKFLVCAALLMLVQMDRVNVLVALIIIGREIAISALREWMAELGARRKVAVSSLGKVKTILQIVGLSMMLIRWDVWFLPTYQVGLALTVIAAIFTLISGWEHLRAAWPDLRSGSS